MWRPSRSLASPLRIRSIERPSTPTSASSISASLPPAPPSCNRDEKRERNEISPLRGARARGSAPWWGGRASAQRREVRAQRAHLGLAQLELPHVRARPLGGRVAQPALDLVEAPPGAEPREVGPDGRAHRAHGVAAVAAALDEEPPPRLDPPGGRRHVVGDAGDHEAEAEGGRGQREGPRGHGRPPIRPRTSIARGPAAPTSSGFTSSSSRRGASATSGANRQMGSGRGGGLAGGLRPAPPPGAGGPPAGPPPPRGGAPAARPPPRLCCGGSGERVVGARGPAPSAPPPPGPPR